MRVVVFDDLLVFRQEDYRVDGLDLVFYADADDAIAVVEREVPEIVLMDFSMSARDTGADAVKRLRTRFSSQQLRIVGISSDATSNARMIHAGADDSVAKSQLRGYLARLAAERK